MKPQRSLILVLLLVSIAWPLPAQQRRLDSLQRIVQTLPESDTSHIRALTSLSEMYLGNEPERGRAYLDAALRLSERYGYKKGVAAASLGIGKYHIDRRQIDSALWHVRRGRAIYEQVRWAIGLGNAHNFLGMIHSMRGEYRNALEEFTVAARIYEELGRRDRMAHALGNSGVQYHEQGIYDSAAAVFERALRISEDVGDKAGAANWCVNLANALVGDSIRMAYYRRGLDLYKEAGDANGVNRARYSLGSIQSAAGDRENARKTLEQVVEQARELRDPVTLVGALNTLGNMHRDAGDAVRAVEFYEQALGIANTTAQTRISALIHVNLGRLYLGALDYVKAVESAESGLNAARAVSDRETEHLALLLLANAEQIMGNPAAALVHHRAAYVLRDSIYSENSAKHMNGLLTKYEADKREKELRLLHADQALNAAELRRQGAELARRVLLTRQQAQSMELITRERDVERISAERASTELALQKETAVRNARETALRIKENQLQGSVLSRERLLRNALLSGAVLLAAVALLGFKRMRGHRREEALRAETAVYKARAAEAQALALAAETERREKQAQQDFARQLIGLQEQERKRISSELHDGLSQELIVIRNHAILAIQANGDTDTARTHLDELVSMASTALTDVRQISRALRPYQIEQLGLSETIRAALRHVAKTAPLRLLADIADIDGLLSNDMEVTLFRLVQESVSNILKHAEASDAVVHAERLDGEICLTVKDNGIGFDTGDGQTPGSRFGNGLGLRSMSERVSMLNGEMELVSAPGRGTHITIRIPVQPGGGNG